MDASTALPSSTINVSSVDNPSLDSGYTGAQNCQSPTVNSNGQSLQDSGFYYDFNEAEASSPDSDIHEILAVPNASNASQVKLEQNGPSSAPSKPKQPDVCTVCRQSTTKNEYAILMDDDIQYAVCQPCKV